MDPSLLAEILGLEKNDNEPELELRPAYIIGYERKLWGQYPALLNSDSSAQGSSSVVEGAVYNVQTVEDGEKLAAYETGNYRTESCLIHYTDGKEPSQELGYTFLFAGNPNDLSEGSFDLKVWLRRMGRRRRRQDDALEKVLEAKKESPPCRMNE